MPVPVTHARPWLAVLFWLLLPQVGAGQTPRFERLSVLDGLSQSAVSGMVQGPQGFLWIATLDGLNRYDGYRFRIYRNDPDDPHSLGDNNIRSLTKDRSNTLWLGTSGGGLNHFDPATERFTHYRHDPADAHSLSSDKVWGLHQDSTGLLWVGSDRGLNRLDPATGRFERHLHDSDDPASLSHNVVWSVLEDRDGVLWLGTDGGGLNRFDRTTGRFEHYRHDPDDPNSLSHDSVWSIYQDAAGALWISTFGGGLNRFEPQSGRFTRYQHDPDDATSLSHDNVKEVYEDRAGQLWVGTNGGGVSRFDRANERFTALRHDPQDAYSLSHDNVWTIYEDLSGKLWIGTNGGGLSRHDPATERFVRYQHDPDDPASLTDNNIRALDESPSGVVWVGTNGKGFNRLDPASGRSRRYQHDPDDPASLSNDNVWCLHEDRWGFLWVGTNTGLNRMIADGQFEVYAHDPDDPSSLSSDRVWAIHEDGAGVLWLGTDGGGLNRLDPATGEVTHYRHDPADASSLSSDDIHALFEDRAGALWIGTGGGGLNRLEPSTGQITRYIHHTADARSLSSNSILSFHQDPGGTLWIGTDGGGLNRFDAASESFRAFRQKDGLPNDVIYGILEDAQRHLWLSTNEGLCRFDPGDASCHTYDVSDGLLGNEFNSGAFLASRSGRFYFGGIDGLIAFSPDRLERNLHVPPVVLTSFKKYNQEAELEVPVARLSTLQLSHLDDLVSFEVAALDFSAPARNRYAYKMDGLDEDWIELGSKRDITFTDLDAGEYTLRVRGSNNDGVWNDEGLTLPISVSPAPWQSGWAYTLYGLAALAAALVGARSYRRELQRERQINDRLRQIDRLKDEFLANTSHELRTPLYGISGLAESLIDGAAGELPAAAKAHLAMVVASGRRLTSLVDDILDFSKLRHHNLELDLKPVDLRSVIDVVLTLLRPLVGTKNLQLASQLAPNLPPVLADEHRLQQILHNLVGNAIKFTEAGEIEVGAERRGDRLRVSVRDTGIGIAEEQQGRIFEAFVQADGSTDRELGGTGLGLAVTGQLVELHNSQLQLDSALGEGSTFWFDLPIAESRPAATPSVEERPPSHVPVLAPSAAASPEGSSIVEGNTESVALQGSTEAHSPSIILVVDDEPVNRQVLVNQLAGEGYHVVQAASGGEALEWLEENTPDLLLLDVMMPRMSGYEVCRTLRQRFEPGELPVLFLTAKNRSSDSVAGFDVGANDYLPKPISKSELLARVTTHLALRTVNRQLSDLVVERTTEVARRERLIEALETKNAELERFNYSVAHDLKNPLVTIMNYLGLARRDAAAGEAERLGQHFDRLQTAADKLHLQLEDLFELSRVGLQPQAIEIVPFGEVVQGALGILAPQIRESGAALTVADELPTVRGDRQQIQELLRQLVDNALRHVVAGRSPRIEVGVRPGEGGGNSGSIFYVRDDGPGIEAKFQTRIFELFERLEPDAFPGTGIGLALAKRIVEAHGGRIWVESDGLGHGSTFCFTTGRDLD